MFVLEVAKILTIIQGANIPGKPREPLNYAGGIPQYLKTIRAAVDNDFEGFTLS